MEQNRTEQNRTEQNRIVKKPFTRLPLFPWHKNLCHRKQNFFEQITKKQWILKFTLGIFEIPKNAVATTFRKP